MKRPVMIVFGLCGLVWGYSPVPAWAQNQYNQPVNPYARPVFSPYLNLNRQGSSPAVNYYGIVRPEISFTRSIQQLRQQDTQLQQNVTNLEEAATLPVTGHASGFMNYRTYFMSMGGRAGTGPQATPITAAPTRPMQPTGARRR